MKLSIITPYYNCWNFIKELAEILIPQLTDDVEWIIIDDGCHESRLDSFKANIIHLYTNNGCGGIPRNYGLDIAKGDFITFIDADDLVSKDFVKQILDKIEQSDFDYCFMSWEKPNKQLYVNIAEGRPAWNCSVWGVVYKKDIINNTRFSANKIGEDYEFNQQVLKGKEERICRILYYYRDNENSIMNSIKKGDDKNEIH